MADQSNYPQANAIGALQRFVRRNASEERCDLCGAGLAGDHEHLIEPADRRLICVCQACAILFSGEAGQRYKRVPRDIHLLPGFQLTDAQWDCLLVPINMAFFFTTSGADALVRAGPPGPAFRSATGKVIAIYPSPAGATESLLPLETWDQIVAGNRELSSMEPDVEALLVNRLGPERGFPTHQYFRLPIDQCFKLVGLVRANWHGLSGGDELWRAIHDYFTSLTARAGLGMDHLYA